MRRWMFGGAGLVIVVVALVLVLGGALDPTSSREGALVAHRGGGLAIRHTHGGRPASTATVPATPTLAPAVLNPAGRRLARAMGGGMNAPGMAGSALVFDLTTGRALYARRATLARAPASVEKLWTSVALLRRLGPGFRLHTTILGTGRLRHGTWDGDLYLRGGGDPTFGDATFNAVWNHGSGADASTLVAALHARGIRRVRGRLYADESLFDRRRGALITDYRPDVPDLGGQLSALTYDHGTTLGRDTPATFAAHEVALTMRAMGIHVTAATRSRRTPADATPLASVASPPLETMLRLMNVPSDDFFAELLAKQLGVLYGHGGSITSGAHVIAATIAADYDLHPRILDGSGLGRGDRTSPLQIVDLLRDTWRTPTGQELIASLPVTGVSGTVTGIGARTAAQGRCSAKTGSLNYVTNLAGVCRTRSGQEIAFGIFLDGPDNATGFGLESQMVAAIARY